MSKLYNILIEKTTREVDFSKATINWRANITIHRESDAFRYFRYLAPYHWQVPGMYSSTTGTTRVKK